MRTDEIANQVLLNDEEWSAVLSQLENDDTSLFILLSLANLGYCEVGSIHAFLGKVKTDQSNYDDQQQLIANIKLSIKSIKGCEEGSCLSWNDHKSRWSIGYYNFRELRRALDMRDSKR